MKIIAYIIAIESPCNPGILQLAGSMGLNVLELPTHPTMGIEIKCLKKAISKVNRCLLVPNFNTPLGSCMPDENKKEVVKLLAKHTIPLMEDDIYGDLYFGSQRPKCCRSLMRKEQCYSVVLFLNPWHQAIRWDG